MTTKETDNSKPKFCPCCASDKITEGQSAFVEMGEWNGKTYENEFDATQYNCAACLNSFVF